MFLRLPLLPTVSGRNGHTTAVKNASASYNRYRMPDEASGQIAQIAVKR
jgi:hypothetical protein